MSARAGGGAAARTRSAALAAMALLAGLLLRARRAEALESVQMRLLRSAMIGVPQRVTLEEMREVAGSDQYTYNDHVLARCALAAMGRDSGFGEWPLPTLLERSLNQLQRRSAHYQMPADTPPGYGGKEQIFLLVHTMVMTGQTEQAIDVLKSALESESDYVRAVSLQALRHIGSPRASGLIQQVSDQVRDSNLPDNLMADQLYPFLHELAARQSSLSQDRRGRQELREQAERRDGEAAVLAVYYLGFMTPSEDPSQEAAELALLRGLTADPRFLLRYCAIRSLALRSRETLDFWVQLFRSETDGWQRAQLVRIGFIHYGREFADLALELLGSVPVQYVQWELMHGIVLAREGVALRTRWDLWFPTNLQLALTFKEEGGEMPAEDVVRLLAWLESGARPQDDWVRNHLLHALAAQAHGDATARLLAVIDGIQDKGRPWWVLSPLDDPAALPRLREWAALPPVDAEQHRQLTALIERLAEEARAAPAASQGLRGLIKPPRPEATDRAACEAMGGEWGRFGLAQEEACDLPTTDGGQVCADAVQCQSICVTDERTPAGQEAVGWCFPRTIVRGQCVNHVTNGKATGVLCVD